METDWKNELAQLITFADTRNKADQLLVALLTPAEHEELAKRWQIVKQLIEEVTQREIKDNLGASIATVTRGSRELHYGNGAFQKFYQYFQTK